MSSLGMRVPATTRKKLRATAAHLRKSFGIATERFPIEQVVDVGLSAAFDGQYTFAVLGQNEMGNDHGLTDPDRKIMLIREDVYDGACLGSGRDRFTLAHELGHFVLHGNTYLARSLPSAVGSRHHEKYEDSEWQADTFAAELLMPVAMVQACSSPAELMERAGVSRAAAETRFKVLRNEGLIR